MIKFLKSFFVLLTYTGSFFCKSRGVNADFPELCEDLQFRELTIKDFSKSALFQENGRLERYKNHLSKGYRCWGFVTGSNEVVFYLWFTIGKTAPWYKGLTLNLNSIEAYIWDCRTESTWQKMGLYKAALKNITDSLMKEGIEKVYIDCSSDNIASEKGILSSGFELYKKFRVIKFKSLFYFKLSGSISIQTIKKPVNLS